MRKGSDAKRRTLLMYQEESPRSSPRRIDKPEGAVRDFENAPEPA
jgi:hypothetical protein